MQASGVDVSGDCVEELYILRVPEEAWRGCWSRGRAEVATVVRDSVRDDSRLAADKGREKWSLGGGGRWQAPRSTARAGDWRDASLHDCSIAQIGGGGAVATLAQASRAVSIMRRCIIQPRRFGGRAGWQHDGRIEGVAGFGSVGVALRWLQAIMRSSCVAGRADRRWEREWVSCCESAW